MDDYIQSNILAAKQRWFALFGAFVPQVDMSEISASHIENIAEWVSEFPKTMSVCQNGKKLTLDSSFLC